MEAVGVVASIATLVAVAKEVSVLTAKLVNDFQAAPKQLAQLQNHANLVSLGLQCLEKVSSQPELGNVLDQEDLWLLSEALNVAKQSISCIHKECIAIGGTPSRRRRVAWTLFESKKTTEYLQQIQRMESSLGVVLQLVNMKTVLTTPSLFQPQRIKPEPATSALSSGGDVSQWAGFTRSTQSTLVLRTDPVAYKQFFGTSRFSSFWEWLLACEIFMLSCGTESQRTNYCYARITIPTLEGYIAFILSLSFRRTSSSWRRLNIFDGRLSVVSYVADDSDVVSACRKGDLLAVRDSVMHGEATPSDISYEGKSLLWYAVESGSTELFQFLLDGGAAVTPGVFFCTAYWRHSGLARLCLEKGADAENVGTDGMSAPAYLFGSSRKPESQTEYLQILACNSFSDFDCQDPCGWSVLHRAAAFGTREDVKTLLGLKASTHVQTRNLAWTPLFCAVCFSHQENLQELWESSGAPKRMEDLRGWNLLHVAAGAGNFSAVPFLLEQGVDLDAVSRPTSRIVPRSLVDRRVTPSQVALAFGEESYRIWCATLESCGRKPDPSFEDIDWSAEEEHVAYGGCECCETWGF